MSERLTREQLACAGEGYDPVAARSASIGAGCYVDPAFLEVERAEIFRRSWQFRPPPSSAAATWWTRRGRA